MDRIHQIQGEAERSKDFTLDTSSAPSEAFLTANESSSKFYSLSEEDSTFIVSPSKESSSTSNVDNSITESNLISNLSPIPKTSDLGSFKIGKHIEAANILSGGVNIFDDNSYEGDELVIDDNPTDDGKDPTGDENESSVSLDKTDEALDATDVIPSKETEVVLQIDGKNVDAIDIGNGLYLYRKTGEEELAAVQIIDDEQQQPSFKFLKVRENAEGNLEVYEEIEIEVPKEMPTKKGKPAIDASQTPIKDVNKLKSDPFSVKTTDITPKMSQKELVNNELENKELEKSNRELQESKSELNLNGKTMKFSESRKSPVISTFTPMTYHSTPNKEGIPLTKTMVDQHLQPNRHSDNVKKTIEVHTENKQKITEATTKNKECESKIDSADIETKDVIENKDENESKFNSIDNKAEDFIDQKTVEEVPITCKDKLLLAKENILQDKDDNTKMGDENKESTNHDSISFDEMNSKSSTETQISILTDCDTRTQVQKDLLVHESMSDNMEPDVDDKLVIAEDILTITEDLDNIKESNVVNSVTSIDLETKDVEKHFDSSVIVEKCSHTVEKIERVKESESKEKELEGSNCFENKEITTPTESHSKPSIHDVCQIRDIDKGLVENEKAINFDFITKKNNNLSTLETKKDQQHKIHEAIATDSNKIFPELFSQQKLEEPKKNTDETLKLNTNISSSQRLGDIKKTGNLLSKEEKSIRNNNVKSLEEFKFSTKEKSQSFAIKQSNAISPNAQLHTIKPEEIKDNIEKVQCTEDKSACPAAILVPFGKWTEENRQDFLNKIKESKVITTNSNAKQIKQPNDLNRRDVLKKIDSQRQSNNILTSSKVQDINAGNRVNTKASTVTFKNSSVEQQNTSAFTKTKPKEEGCVKSSLESKSDVPQNKSEIHLTMTNKLLTQRKEINNQDLIDKTIEGIINRALPAKVSQEDKPSIEPNAKEIEKKSHLVTLDDIERKMNELHGIPFVERPPHELPAHESKLSDNENLNVDKNECLPNVILYTNKHNQNVVKESVRSNISEEEIIEHEPITGDIANFNKGKINQETVNSAVCNNSAKKEPIITERDFDKFARRNSITYENCLTVNFNRREPHNVIQSIVPKDIPAKKMSRNELMLAESKAKSTHKHQSNRHQNHSSKIPAAVRSTNEGALNKNYQSKVKIAYQSALTAKRQQGSITIIEDKPVKVVFMDSNAEFVPMQLNVQGQELSPSKNHANENTQYSASESIDSEILDISNESKSQDNKSKIKHQRKQVLTPVATPELELIEPGDLGIESSPKKKRRVEDKFDKKTKALVPKKSYLLNRNVEVDKQTKSQNLVKNAETETVDKNESYMVHSDPISAIDNLVKAAELLETQCENSILSNNETNIQQNTLVKRGRGRPRKYPLPGNDSDTNKTPSPQKNNRILESNSNKQTSETENSGDEEIKENWTMGKINENIVCPICNKLFRSENVVFKHVKHCTGPSPNRSDSDKRSSHRSRHSEDTKPSSIDSNSEDIDSDEEKITPRKRKSRDPKPVKDKPEDIVDEKSAKDIKQHEVKQLSKLKSKMNNLVCELCGKTFRQLSYLLSHKLQHKEDIKNIDNVNKNIFSCEVCKKQFRKLHHLVQHRIIHDPNAMSSRLSRKGSSENHENKNVKIQPQTKQSEDHSAGFRCEPCDKSFRKLHHLVEHRETHDGINKKIVPQSIVENIKSPSMHQCDICKKTFKKLQHLMEHKDQHLETSSEKSDDKSVQSSLSTRDIIHECSLCYMVFPNEHSLNKHTIICQRKKKQSAAKQAKQIEEQELNSKEESKEDIIEEETAIQPQNKVEPEIIEPVPTHDLTESQFQHVDHNEEISKPVCDSKLEGTTENDSVAEDSDSKSDDLPLIIAKTSIIDTEKSIIVNDSKPLHTKTEIIETIIIPDTPTPKKRPAIKEKFGITVTKKLRSCNMLKPVTEVKKVESSDDDEVRYMLNPKYQDADTLEEKFMKVRAEKRSSLQIERPNSKDLVKRRISLQHPPKIPRLKAKPVETRPLQTATVVKKPKPKVLETVASTDSDDSDIKYSFPETVVEKSAPKIAEQVKRKSLKDKRKSLGGVAKRKSLGKQNVSAPMKYIRKRCEVEHRCDCGQLFSSAALLSRHTTLAHTPPRIRKRRSPPPDNIKPQKQTQPQPIKPTIKQNKSTTQPKVTTQKQNTNVNKKLGTRKSSNSDTKAADETKTESNASTRRNAPNRAIPLPEKVRRVNKL